MEKKARKRHPDIVVISDVHLGTYGCHAKELNAYLKSIRPKILVLNGDIIDIWRFSKHYFPKSHLQVLRRILRMMERGTKVYYLTGNHDELLRIFPRINTNKFTLANRVVLPCGNKKAWIFHGDIFDVSIQHVKWLAKLGSVGYDLLILINRFVNFCAEVLGYQRIPLSKRVKDSVKQAVEYISQFETVAAELAIEKGYDYFICGHIHQPANKRIVTARGQVHYLNSGDWVENLTALEFENDQWRIYYHHHHYKDTKKKHQKNSQPTSQPILSIVQPA
ncbi:MAG: UDP-2,3-diacylglucosamine diphosphatase [Cytophagales bacterium]|nr:UDP-2,3-diacylglucosamine diphosphatase [Bernardetiaceae bacterium]MDW8210144.1 UDP-2,3-diacylglucosamine diphosphatase [Cytophagales bacterium]